MSQEMLDVLVVGAGPVGLALAIDLARRGISCRLIDQASTPAIGSRARSLSLRSQEVLRDLGALDALLPLDDSLAPMRFHEANGRLSESNPAALFPAVPPPYRPVLMVNQVHTEAVLRDRLAFHGHEVEWGARLVALEQDPARVLARVEREGKREVIEARYLVGCDGGQSTVRTQAGISFLSELRAEERMVLANVDLAGLDPAFSHSWARPGAAGLTLSFMPRSGFWSFSAPLATDGGSELPAPTLETLQRLFDARAGLAGVRLSNPRWIAIWNPGFRMVERYRAGRIFLAGDAAHVHPSAGGQGLNTGLQDAYNLGWKLARVIDGAPGALLDTYEEERLPISKGVLETTTVRHRAFQRDRSASLKTLLAGQERFADITQLSLSLRGCTLARDVDGAPRIRAGDRAPDAVCQREGVRLFDFFRGTRFTLLTFGETTVPSFPERLERHLRRQSIAPGDEAAFRAYGIAGEALVLVRPDGYVGLTSSRVEPEPVRAYLHEVIG